MISFGVPSVQAASRAGGGTSFGIPEPVDDATRRRVTVLANRIHRGRVRTLTDDELTEVIANAAACGVSVAAFDDADEERERRKFA